MLFYFADEDFKWMCRVSHTLKLHDAHTRADLQGRRCACYSRRRDACGRVFAWLYFVQRQMTRCAHIGEAGRVWERESKVLAMGWGWGLSEPRGWVRLQMYTQCSGAQAKGWITECCCFSRAACFSSLCALFCWMPRAAVHRRCLSSSSRTDALSHPTSSIRTAPVLMSPKKNTQGTEIQRGGSRLFHCDVICH